MHLARVIAQLHDAVDEGRPALLFLDEPTANLDLKHQYQILRTARDFAARGTAVCLILHDLQQARQVADHVLLLASGRTAAYGPPAEVLTPQAIRRVFEVETEWLSTATGHLLNVTLPASSSSAVPPSSFHHRT